jgi:hypothetical protein
MQNKPRYAFGNALPVLAEWTDSASTGRWDTPEAYARRAGENTGPIRSVGWINRKDHKVVQLVQTQSGANGDVVDAITIPRGCIRSIRRLRR